MYNARDGTWSWSSSWSSSQTRGERRCWSEILYANTLFITLLLVLGRRDAVPILVEPAFLDILDHGTREEVANGETTLEEEADLGGRHVVLDQLADQVNVVPPTWQVLNALLDIRASTLDDESTIAAKNVVELWREFMSSMYQEHERKRKKAK
jgi:hypothetical protein